MTKVLHILIILAVPIFLLLSLYPHPRLSLSNDVVNPINKDIVVSATISTQGESKTITIFGYTSPRASVTVTGVGLADITIADEMGFFRFIQTIVYKNTKEICLYAKDTEGRIAQPTCIPFHYSATIDGIGPVVLAPSITVSKGEYLPNEPITYSGQSIPNKNVRLYINTELLQNPFFASAASVNEAPTKKIVEMVTDEKGKFSLFTKSESPQTQRAYSGVNYNGANSPKSTQLTIRILPWWMLLVTSLKSLIRHYGFELALLFEGLFILFFILKKHKNTYAIIVRKKQQLNKMHRDIVPYDYDKALIISG